jgi:cytoskeleton protein RodZ
MKRTGELLKKAREEKGLSLHEVALFLKINSRVLQAIEENDQSQLPARTFLRGFIQSYAKFLKLDSNEILKVFAEENSVNAPPAAQVRIAEPDEAPVSAQPSTTKTEESSPQEVKPVETKTEVDVISLEKSILAKNQMPSDKLGFRTIAISIAGLILVGVIYFANNVIKKYRKEAQIDTPVATATIDSTDSNDEDAVDDTPAMDDSTKSEPAKTASEPSPMLNPTPSPTNSTQSHSAAAGNSVVAPISLPTPIVETKPKLVDKQDQKLIEKPTIKIDTNKPADKNTTATNTPKPADKPSEKTADKLPDKKDATKEGKLVEVIVEANDNVEIEYSSAKTEPQKMVLKADQIHTFKSRSGVKLKISNGGAVNIIVNGRDLGAPGAAGQPVQVAY